ncbi:MAG: 3,5-cyclic-AMP phosphodiesterase [Solirubrobacteraceae bacterium]|nr:3,5-cyclic-AMP phosphodiesterase [Solirubrobacteraceae bacterium]MEA2243942.1 3,5-cyclic-AMP phosphodiesterase [Solirubrobacteraceae bacterium]
MSGVVDDDHEDDGVDRRGFLKCMAWAGTGVVWTLGTGGFTSRALGNAPGPRGRSAFSFVQISDSHIGFDKPANQDVVGTLEECVRRINALPHRPSFVMHTGDHVHLSTPAEFDTVKQILGTIKADRVFHVPGEHDVFVDRGRRYRQFFGRGSHGSGYYSFDVGGVHFLALANVQGSEAESQGAANGLGVLGHEQRAFIKKDLARLRSDTPVVVFGHVPLLAVYPEWGWATADSAAVLALLRRFSSVTALNGHIHQVISKTEGRIVMHTAASTAYPLHPPGDVAPEPLVLPAGDLPSRIGIRTVHFRRGSSSLALVDESLASANG